MPWPCLGCSPSRSAGCPCPVCRRRASISCFKGRYMVNIREYYEKDGQQLPGQKGISLPEEQWTRLLGGLPGLAAALEAA